MTETARDFFDGLEDRLNTEKLEGQTVSYRFDIAGVGSWRVGVDEGELSVEEGREDADCVIVMKEEVFLRLLRGEQNPAAAFMLGRIKVEGDMAYALKLKELFF
jgi:putative sterol carrier protein